MKLVPLHRLKPGEPAEVVELRTSDPVRLDRLGALGLVPGSHIVLQQMVPALVFRVGETEVSVDREIAEQIYVRAAKR